MKAPHSREQTLKNKKFSARGLHCRAIELTHTLYFGGQSNVPESDKKRYSPQIGLGASQMATMVGLVLRGKSSTCISAALVAKLAVLLRCFADADSTNYYEREIHVHQHN